MGTYFPTSKRATRCANEQEKEDLFSSNASTTRSCKGGQGHKGPQIKRRHDTDSLKNIFQRLASTNIFGGGEEHEEYLKSSKDLKDSAEAVAKAISVLTESSSLCQDSATVFMDRPK